jgi:putative hemolysin
LQKHPAVDSLRHKTAIKLPSWCHPVLPEFRNNGKKKEAYMSEIGAITITSPANRVLSPPPQQTVASDSKITVEWAKNLDEVREAQRLRYAVFATEMGARLDTALPGHDIDLFDNFCEHLLVRDAATREVVGTYRVLTPVQAKRVGST